MKMPIEALIDNLVDAALGSNTARERFLFRESLRNLVRVAKAEQMVEIKANVAKLTGADMAAGSAGHQSVKDLLPASSQAGNSTQRPRHCDPDSSDSVSGDRNAGT